MSEVKSGVVEGGKGIFEGDFKLDIPNYQRPYVWGREQVRILLEDIQESLSQGKEYLLGSLILCRSQNPKECQNQVTSGVVKLLTLMRGKKDSKQVFDIVDGQQRLTTLALILRALDINKKQDGEGTQESVSDNFLSDAEFEHNHSKHHIKDNWEFIKEWFEGKGIDKKDWLKKILKKIEFIYVLAPSLDDAFIFFDSANAKGKALEEYDLMKAFHLRVLENDSKKLVPYYAKRFEELAKKKGRDSLKVFFEEIIAPLRVWIRQEKINTDEIRLYDEFCKEENKRDEIASHRDLGVARGIVGGEDFFIYLDEYMQMFEMVKSDELYQSLFNLSETWHYTCYLYAMALILYFDKFEKKSDEMIRLIARVVLVLRLEQNPIKKGTITNRAIELLPKIFFAQTHSELKRFLEKEKTDKLKRFLEKKEANGPKEITKWKSPEDWRKKSKEILREYDETYWKSVFSIADNQNNQNKTKGK